MISPPVKNTRTGAITTMAGRERYPASCGAGGSLHTTAGCFFVQPW